MVPIIGDVTAMMSEENKTPEAVEATAPIEAQPENAAAEAAAEHVPEVAAEAQAEVAQEAQAEVAPEAPAAEAAVQEVAPEAPAAEAAAQEATPEAPAAEVAAQEAAPEAPAAEAQEAESESAHISVEEREAVFAELVAAKANSTPIQVEGKRRVRGGILVMYKGIELYLPTAQLSLKANPSENELLSLIKQTFAVTVQEIDANRGASSKARAVVSRKKILRAEICKDLQVGQVYEGKVVSLMPFGAFVSVPLEGGISFEGLVHVSRITRARLEDPSQVLKVGDPVKVKIVELDPAVGRVAFSMVDFTNELWSEIVEKAFKLGDIVKGNVRQVSESHAFLTLPSGVRGFLHVSEASWTRRSLKMNEMLSVGDEIDVKIMRLNNSLKRVHVSLKQATENPWLTIPERYPIGSKQSGVVVGTVEKGVVVRLANEIDAFLPNGKMTAEFRDKRASLPENTEIEVIVMDVVPASTSVIVGLEGFDQGARRPQGERRSEGGEERRNRGRRQDRPQGGNRGEKPAPAQEAAPAASPVTLSDLLSEDEKRRLFGEG